jgi:2-oxoisovalerate dehydrogenase E2 component (dihydrolipoyl transacylase)
MPQLQQFRLPDVGEGLTEGEVLQWLVSVGDTVVVNQPLVEVETAKAAVELPSPWAGVVTELLAQVGETVEVGTPIISIDTQPGGGGGTSAAPAATGEPEPASEPEQDARVASAAGPDPSTPTGARQLAATEFVPAPKPQREAVLVGYGVMSGSVTRRRRRTAAGAPGDGTPPGVGNGTTARAKPPVRKLAKDLGIDLTTVRPSGPDGTVTRDDVQREAAGRGAGSGVVMTPVPVGSALMGERREEVKGVRRYMAEAMVRSAFTIPHVTEWTEVDVTRSVKLLRRLRETPGFQQTRVGPLLLVARAVVAMASVVPEVNAVWDDDNGEVVYKEHVNLGFAADTPRGLVVPNIKAADQLSLPELAVALSALVETARAGRTTPADMAGGTFTITNVGVFGIDGGTPIINPGESAILAVGAFRERPWVHKGRVRPRWVVQLALSFDHRFIDGATGARFLGGVAGILHDPAVPPTA